MVECEFPECTTFGSVIRFSLELEKGAAGVYEELAAKPEMSSVAETFRTLSESHKKRGVLLENTRREKLNEMILEPIQDIVRENYLIDTKIPAGLDPKGAAQFAAKIEGTSAKFYTDSSKIAKTLLSEAARIMDRLSKENSANKAKLEAL
jgi:rubrerythrin